MITFFIGLVILAVGALLYGRFCEKIMKPTDSKTPAVFFCDNGVCAVDHLGIGDDRAYLAADKAAVVIGVGILGSTVEMTDLTGQPVYRAALDVRRIVAGGYQISEGQGVTEQYSHQIAEPEGRNSVEYRRKRVGNHSECLRKPAVFGHTLRITDEKYIFTIKYSLFTIHYKSSPDASAPRLFCGRRLCWDFFQSLPPLAAACA